MGQGSSKGSSQGSTCPVTVVVDGEAVKSVMLPGGGVSTSALAKLLGGK